MPSFTVITAMPIFIAFGALLNEMFLFIKNKFANLNGYLFAFLGLASILVILKIDLDSLAKKHSTSYKENFYSIELFRNRNNFKSMRLQPKSILFNVNERHYVEAMFYTDAVAYNFIPSERQLEEVIGKGYIQ